METITRCRQADGSLALSCSDTDFMPGFIGLQVKYLFQSQALARQARVESLRYLLNHIQLAVPSELSGVETEA